MSEAFPALSRFFRAVGRSWRPVLIVLLVLYAVFGISNHIERRYVKPPFIAEPRWEASKYGSSKNPYRHYEAAIRLVSDEDRDVISLYRYFTPPGRKPVTDEQLAAAHAHVQPAIAELKKGAACSGKDSQLAHRLCSREENFPEYLELHKLARVGSADAEYKISQGRVGEGIGELLDVSEMGHDIAGSGPLTDTLVGYVVNAIAARPIYRAMGSTGLSAADYRAIARSLERKLSERRSFGDIMARQYILERNSLPEMLWPGYDKTPKVSRKSFGPLWPYVYMPPGMKTWTIRNFDRAWRVTLEYCRKPYPQAVKLDKEKLIPRYDPLVGARLPVFHRAMDLDALGKAMDGGLMLMAALEAFRQEHASYPASLEALVGRYISKVPVDPFTDGKPFRYSRTEKGYMLYSVGPDKVDGGGKVVLPYPDVIYRDRGDVLFVPGVNVWSTKRPPPPGG